MRWRRSKMELNKYQENLMTEFRKFYLFSKEEAKRRNLSENEINLIIDGVINGLIEKAIGNMKESTDNTDAEAYEKMKNVLKETITKYKNEIDHKK